MTIDFYNFEAENIKGETIKMSSFKGKTIVVVNTASKCGFTPQLDGLEKLYKTYKNDGLVILGFPCNQFGKQDPGNNEEIESFCEINYGVSFHMFSKIDVNGGNTHPIFEFLKKNLGSLFGRRIKWNFTKFVIDKNGKPVKRFSPTTTPEKMESYLKNI
ncbi:MAG: glutathione peroxidase, partial [Flavobacteriales bacterium]